VIVDDAVAVAVAVGIKLKDSDGDAVVSLVGDSDSVGDATCVAVSVGSSVNVGVGGTERVFVGPVSDAVGVGCSDTVSETEKDFVIGTVFVGGFVTDMVNDIERVGVGGGVIVASPCPTG
jgi:hypothetical protein